MSETSSAEKCSACKRDFMGREGRYWTASGRGPFHGTCLPSNEEDGGFVAGMRRAIVIAEEVAAANGAVGAAAQVAANKIRAELEKP